MNDKKKRDVDSDHQLEEPSPALPARSSPPAGMTRRRFMASLLGAALLATGCAPTGAQADQPATAGSQGPLTAASEMDRETIAAVTEDNADFGLDLYRQLARETDGNMFMSPHSISTALAMTWSGATGDTAEQMADAMNFQLPPEELHTALAGLQRSLQAGDDDPYQLAIANRLFGEQTAEFHEAFINGLNEAYGAGLEEVDFKGNADEVREDINEWVEEQTRDKIKDLLPPGSLDAYTRLVLTNAIYFKGNWAVQFDEDDTRPMPFALASGEQVETETMYQKESFRYGQYDGVQLLEMPYEGDRLSMVALLPEQGELGELEESLTAKTLDEWLTKSRKQDVHVYLPKFTMTTDFVLNQPLSEMGMPKAFTREADFSGMTDISPLFISLVVHKAFVDVNEEGTEAAAATAVVMTTESAMPMEPEFRADRPFMFAIRDNESGALLFLGRVMDPRSEG